MKTMDMAPFMRQLMAGLVWVLSATISGVEADCTKMQVKDTTYQNSREGTYSPSDDSCNGRTVYKKSGSNDNYIYFIETVDGWRGWMIGSTSCTNKGGMAAESEAATPDQISTKWEEVYSGSWWYTSAEVVCADMTVGAIVGIVVAIIIVIVLVAVTVYCCCKSNSNKNRRNNNNTSPSSTSTSTTGATTTHVSTVAHANPSFSYGPYPQNAGPPPQAWAAPGQVPTGPQAAPPYSPSMYNVPPPAYSATDPVYPPGSGPNQPTAPPPLTAVSPPPAYTPEGPK